MRDLSEQCVKCHRTKSEVAVGLGRGVQSSDLAARQRVEKYLELALMGPR